MTCTLLVSCFRLKNKGPPKVPARDYPGKLVDFDYVCSQNAKSTNHCKLIANPKSARGNGWWRLYIFLLSLYSGDNPDSDQSSDSEFVSIQSFSPLHLWYTDNNWLIPYCRTMTCTKSHRVITTMSRRLVRESSLLPDWWTTLEETTWVWFIL